MFRELRTSGDARPGRILRAVPQVMSLFTEYKCPPKKEHDSNSDSIVSHPNDTTQPRGWLENQRALAHQTARPVCWSVWILIMASVRRVCFGYDASAYFLLLGDHDEILPRPASILLRH